MNENPCEGCLVEPLCTDMCEKVKPLFFGEVKVGRRTVTINTKNTLYGNNTTDDIRDITFDVEHGDERVLELKEKYCGPIKKKTKKKKK
jgi:hypothetical protein